MGRRVERRPEHADAAPLRVHVRAGADREDLQILPLSHVFVVFAAQRGARRREEVGDGSGGAFLEFLGSPLFAILKARTALRFLRSA